ncbi:MAG: class II aldolase/adducin family protein [candidate division Zixibacteria bacterium]|nr:class II aldolase/adducin family protein [candidate division Zixibacteria bacterium]
MDTAILKIAAEICHIGELIYDKGMIAGTEGNISCRLSNSDILITPAGVCKGMMKPDDLVILTPRGRVRGKGRRQSTESRLHLAGYAANSGFQAAVHVHSRYATSFATAGIPLEGGTLPEFTHTFGQIPLIPYARPGSAALAKMFASVVDHGHTFLLERHGLLAFGSDLREAYYRAEMAEQCAAILWLSHQLVDIGGGVRAR